MSEQIKKLVPKLRFPEFESDREWQLKQLSDFSKIVRGGSPRPIDEYITKNANGLNWLKIGDIDKEAKFVRTTEDNVIAAALSKTRVVNPGDLILSNSMSFGRPYILEIQTCIHDGWIAVSEIDKSLDRDYLYYQMMTPSSQTYFSNNAAGSGVQNLNADIIKLLPVALPSSEEQQKIADCLSSLDDLITAQNQKVEALKQHKKGLMQQLFPAEGETVPKLRFSEFQDKGQWEKLPLSALIKALDAGVSVNSGDRPAMVNEMGILKTSAVTDGIFDSSENKVVTDIQELNRLKEEVTANTIIISRMNTPALVGANAYIETDHKNLFLPDRLWAAKPRSGTSMRFVAFILGSVQGRAALSALATGTSGSMKNIAKASVLELQVLTPSPEEQQKIAECLSSLDELITTQTQQLEAYKAHKKGLMQQLFPSLDEVEAWRNCKGILDSSNGCCELRQQLPSNPR
jgi:type I restriction enzyme S subunit